MKEEWKEGLLWVYVANLSAPTVAVLYYSNVLIQAKKRSGSLEPSTIEVNAPVVQICMGV